MFAKRANRLVRRTVNELSHKSRARLANYCLRLSTYRTRGRLAHSDPVKLLIDNSVLAHAITHETVGVTQAVNWPPERASSEVIVTRRVPVDIRRKYGKKVYNSVQYLPAISHLSRCGVFQLFTSSELHVEQEHQPIGRYKGNKGWLDWWLFDGIEIPSVDGYIVSPFDLAYFRSNPTIDRVIYSTDIDPLHISCNSRQRQIERLERSNDRLYLELSEILPPKSNLDAWHIRTAEKYGLFAFVTMDFKLRSIIEKNKIEEPIASLRSKIMTPAEIGRYFRMYPINPYLCELARNYRMGTNARLPRTLS